MSLRTSNLQIRRPDNNTPQRAKSNNRADKAVYYNGIANFIPIGSRKLSAQLNNLQRPASNPKQVFNMQTQTQGPLYIPYDDNKRSISNSRQISRNQTQHNTNDSEVRLNSSNNQQFKFNNRTNDDQRFNQIQTILQTPIGIRTATESPVHYRPAQQFYQQQFQHTEKDSRNRFIQQIPPHSNTAVVSPTHYNPYYNFQPHQQQQSQKSRQAPSPLHGGNITPDLINPQDYSPSPQKSKESQVRGKSPVPFRANGNIVNHPYDLVAYKNKVNISNNLISEDRPSSSCQQQRGGADSQTPIDSLFSHLMSNQPHSNNGVSKTSCHSPSNESALGHGNNSQNQKLQSNTQNIESFMNQFTSNGLQGADDFKNMNFVAPRAAGSNRNSPYMHPLNNANYTTVSSSNTPTGNKRGFSSSSTSQNNPNALYKRKSSIQDQEDLMQTQILNDIQYIMKQIKRHNKTETNSNLIENGSDDSLPSPHMNQTLTQNPQTNGNGAILQRRATDAYGNPQDYGELTEKFLNQGLVLSSNQMNRRLSTQPAQQTYGVVSQMKKPTAGKLMLNKPNKINNFFPTQMDQHESEENQDSQIYEGHQNQNAQQRTAAPSTTVHTLMNGNHLYINQHKNSLNNHEPPFIVLQNKNAYDIEQSIPTQFYRDQNPNKRNEDQQFHDKKLANQFNGIAEQYYNGNNTPGNNQAFYPRNNINIYNQQPLPQQQQQQQQQQLAAQNYNNRGLVRTIANHNINLNSRNSELINPSNLESSQSNKAPISTMTLDNYQIFDKLGAGSYAVVQLAVDKRTKENVAIKIYDKVQLSDPNQIKNVRRQISIMGQMNHVSIIQLYHIIDTPTTINIVMEYIGKESLYNFLKAQPGRRISEKQACWILKQVLQGIKYMHDDDFVHRDIKLENIMMDNNRNIQLIDFGFSVYAPVEKQLNTFCGTPSYMAPEIVSKQQYEGFPVDIWTCGILLYVLLHGCFPFRGQDEKELYKQIQKGVYQIGSHVSDGGRLFIQNILLLNPNDRPNAAQLCKNQWLNDNINQQQIEMQSQQSLYNDSTKQGTESVLINQQRQKPQ